MRNKQSIDGFVPRRPERRLSGGHGKSRNMPLSSSVGQKIVSDEIRQKNKNLSRPHKKSGYALGHSDIHDSLEALDFKDESGKKLSHRQNRKLAKKSKKPRSLRSKIVKRTMAILFILLIIAGGYLGYKFVNAGRNVLQGNIFDVFKSQPLKKDNNGRSNFLILGTSEDDNDHAGADLTDSMLVASVDQTNKNIYMFSVPRDLYVKYGTACTSGYAGKINAYFSCADSGNTDEAEQNRLTKTQSLVGEIFGLDIQYGVHVNHTVIKEAVNAVGGIDVDIQGSNGAPGVLDRNFDWRCNYSCHLVKYENGVHHLDGEHALFLAQARGDVAPTYGLANSNFDREKNQQKILTALKSKATSTGTLTNLSAITKLIDALGGNLRTNIQTSEIQTLAHVANDIKQEDIHTISLISSEGSVVTTGNYGGASVVIPSAGIFNYEDIKALIAKNLTSNPVAKEAAPIVVLNGTGQNGYGKTKTDALTSEGYTVALTDNAPDGTYDKVEIYQIGTDSNITAKKLTEKYKVTIKKDTPPIEVADNIRFVIIFGIADN